MRADPTAEIAAYLHEAFTADLAEEEIGRVLMARWPTVPEDQIVRAFDIMLELHRGETAERLLEIEASALAEFADDKTPMGKIARSVIKGVGAARLEELRRDRPPRDEPIPQMSPAQRLAFNADPEGFTAAYYGVTVDQLREFRAMTLRVIDAMGEGDLER